MYLKNKVAIITASGSGMGQESANLFAENGAKVCVADINATSGEKVVNEIKKCGGDAFFVQTDIRIMSDVRKMVDKTIQKYKKIDVLFNHVGVPGPGRIEEMTEESFDDVVDTNLKGNIFASQYVINEMRKQKQGGSIIFTASTSGVTGSPHSPVYSMTKGGIILFAKSLARFLATENIRVNCIAPSLANTPMANQFLQRNKNDDLEKSRKMVMDRVPMHRMVEPHEVAKAALYLASEESSFVTGVVLPVDGGYLA